MEDESMEEGDDPLHVHHEPHSIVPDRDEEVDEEEEGDISQESDSSDDESNDDSKEMLFLVGCYRTCVVSTMCLNCVCSGS